MTRSKAQREQDRSDLLAVLEGATEPMWAQHVIAAAYGRRAGENPSYTEESRGMNDLRALARQGLVVCERSSESYAARWSLIGDDVVLTRREEQDDVDDIRRQMARWEPADEQGVAP